MLPRYPVYVISKGRWGKEGLTARFLMRDGVPFKIVVEPQEQDAYAAAFGRNRLLVLPFSNLGQGSIPARNWVWEHARSEGYDRHWILDDNIRCVYRRYRGVKVLCNSGPALASAEDFVDRYENIAIAGFNYSMFCPNKQSHPVFFLNTHVYSFMLICNDLKQRWRGRYNEDTDLCLQVLAAGWCTVLLNVFLADKVRTMTMQGGNSTELYRGDGRLRMARALERMWPGVVRVDRRFGRPQHVVDWRYFDTPLRKKPGVVVDPTPNEYGMDLKQVRAPRSQLVRDMLRRT